jgi:predicted Zn-dependent peptidase
MNSISASNLVSKIKDLPGIQHSILYYGTTIPERLIDLLTKYHKVPDQMNKIPKPYEFYELETGNNQVLFVHYAAKQSRLQTIIKEGRFDPTMAPSVALFNNYFGGNIVFQELREKRALAYTAYSRFQEPINLARHYLSIGYIATQSDKMMDALTAFNALYDNIPVAEITFRGSKNSVLNRICSERITKMNVIWNFLNARKLGLNYDLRKELYDRIPGMDIQDMKAFGRKFLSDRKKTYLVLGNEAETDFQELGTIAPVTKLSLNDIFGY